MDKDRKFNCTTCEYYDDELGICLHCFSKEIEDPEKTVCKEYLEV